MCTEAITGKETIVSLVNTPRDVSVQFAVFSRNIRQFVPAVNHFFSRQNVFGCLLLPDQSKLGWLG